MGAVKKGKINRASTKSPAGPGGRPRKFRNDRKYGRLAATAEIRGVAR